MSPELEKKLYAKYPSLFRQKDLPMSQTLMCFGFEVGDGWYDIINNLCKTLTNHNSAKPIEAVQVKEKFGTLRFYVNYHDEFVDGAIDMAENMSATTCEVCGKRGRSTDSGWIQTLCDEHAAAKGKKLVNEDEE